MTHTALGPAAGSRLGSTLHAPATQRARLVVCPIDAASDAGLAPSDRQRSGPVSTRTRFLSRRSRNTYRSSPAPLMLAWPDTTYVCTVGRAHRGWRLTVHSTYLQRFSTPRLMLPWGVLYDQPQKWTKGGSKCGSSQLRGGSEAGCALPRDEALRQPRAHNRRNSPCCITRYEILASCQLPVP